MARKLKVLFVTSECAPFSKTGGLGDVVGALPKALARRGIDARVVMPLYAGIRWNDLERLEGVLRVPNGFGDRYLDFRVDDHKEPIPELARILSLRLRRPKEVQP